MEEWGGVGLASASSTAKTLEWRAPPNTPTYPHRATLFTSFYLIFYFGRHMEPAGLEAQSSAQQQAPRMIWGGAGQLRGPVKNARPRPLSR